MVADVAQGVNQWWAPALAFAAGVVSFLSPCVLPLVPGYLAMVTGGDDPTHDRRPLLPVLLFILGFSVVFTVVGGFAATALTRAVKSALGQRIAGVVVLAFGVFMLLYALRLGRLWVYREVRPLFSRVKPGPAGAFPLGMAFAVGWTPCIGPVLGAILTLAANQPGHARTVLLLLSYSLGLGAPFLLVGLGLRRLLGAFRFFSRNYHWFAGVSGVALTAIGVLLLTGVWGPSLFRFVSRFTPSL
ncbi:MAG TPA: cytochrome c biogenesis protein CcdA [Actinomycetota bacterium]